MHIETIRVNQSALSVSAKKLAAAITIGSCMTICMTGCMGNREPHATTTCNVYEVENSLGTNACVCGNGTDVYIFQGYEIYRYTENGMELLVDVGNNIEGLTCNSDFLYYLVGTADLYRVDLTSGETEAVDGVGAIYDIFSHDEDIFVIMDEELESGYMDQTLVAYCIQEDGEWENIDALMDEEIRETDVYTTMQYKGYTIGGKRRSTQNSEGETQEYVSVQTISAEDGWNYSYNMSPALEPSRVRAQINGKLFELGAEDYIYDNQSYENTLIKDMYAYGCGPSIAKLHCTVKDGKVYALFQYGERAQAGIANPNAGHKACDALVCIDPEKNTCELIYKSEAKNVQIAGFSVEKEEIYLLYDDGVYRCDFDGSNKTKMMESNGKRMGFVYYDGKMYVYDEAKISTDALWKVLE